VFGHQTGRWTQLLTYCLIQFDTIFNGFLNVLSILFYYTKHTLLKHHVNWFRNVFTQLTESRKLTLSPGFTADFSLNIFSNYISSLNRYFYETILQQATNETTRAYYYTICSLKGMYIFILSNTAHFCRPVIPQNAHLFNGCADERCRFCPGFISNFMCILWYRFHLDV